MASVRRGFVPWPAEIAEQYAQAGLWRGRSIWDEVHQVLGRAPDKVGVVDAAGRWRNDQILAAADTLAGRLLAAGLEPDEAVILQVPNRVEFVVGWLGCLRAGVVPVVALPMHRSAELSHFIRLTGARAHVTITGGPFDYVGLSGELRSELGQLQTVVVDMGELLADRSAEPSPTPPRRAGHDLAHMLVSGGSTGLPKLICRTHDDYAYNARCFGERMRLDRSTVTLVQSPAAHNAALALLVLPTLLVGGTLVMAPSSRPSDTLPLIATERPTYTIALPATVADWTQLPEDELHLLSSFQIILCGAYRLPPEVGHQAHALGLNVLHGYGMAEGFCAFNRPEDDVAAKCETVGLAISPFDSMMVVDENTGEPLPSGQGGELLVRGPYTIRGYYKNPDADQKAFDELGYFRTGDRAVIGHDCRIVILGRIGDVINRGGEKIDPSEVEDALLRIPGIEGAVVFAVADARLGQRPAAALIVSPGASITLEVVGRHLTDAGMARFKHPEFLVPVDRFPLTTAGKVDRRALATAHSNLCSAQKEPSWEPASAPPRAASTSRPMA